VYTPAFVVNGELWHGMRTGQTPDVTRRRAGQLTLKVDRHGAQVRFEPVTPIKHALVFNLAALGMGLETDIKAGERAGGHARNEFVVLAQTRGQSSELKWRSPLPAVVGFHPSRIALVAWVSQPDDPSPLQATGGYVPLKWLR
jgi:hypothetical protein